jgi:1,4-alpha-glucan branching enzyme
MKKWVASPTNEYDRYLFHQGTHYASYTFLGGHLVEQDGQEGARFAVWAPKAQRVSVVGNFNLGRSPKSLGKDAPFGDLVYVCSRPEGRGHLQIRDSDELREL